MAVPSPTFVATVPKWQTRWMPCFNAQTKIQHAPSTTPRIRLKAQGSYFEDRPLTASRFPDDLRKVLHGQSFVHNLAHNFAHEQANRSDLHSRPDIYQPKHNHEQ